MRGSILPNKPCRDSLACQQLRASWVVSGRQIARLFVSQYSKTLNSKAEACMPVVLAEEQLFCQCVSFTVQTAWIRPNAALLWACVCGQIMAVICLDRSHKSVHAQIYICLSACLPACLFIYLVTHPFCYSTLF